MAGGIDWFRWHHGSVSDQKFVLIARRSSASVAEVIAVWACLLEQASLADDRGCAGLPDFEAMDCALGMADGRTQAIYEAMLDRELLNADGFITSWDKRQPKREDDTAAERKRRQREREHELKMAETVTGSESRNVTQSHAEKADVTQKKGDVTHGHDRGEERREEIQEVATPPVNPAPADPARPAPCPTEEIVGLYHHHCPTLQRVTVLNDARRKAISTRWREVITDPDIRRAADPKAAALDWWAWFFDHVNRSPFLTGKAKDWRATIDWLMSPTNFAKVVDGNYHREHAA